MDFDLTEEQQLLRNSARDFLTAKCPKEVVKELEAGETGHSPELWRMMADLGWMGLPVPEEYGGAGFNFLDLAVLFEEVGRAAMPGPLFNTVVTGALPILEFGAEEQKRNFLPEISSGDRIVTMAISEPNVNYDARYIATTATRQPDGFSISGTKLFVPYPHVADFILVAARTGGKRGDDKGITVFIIDAKSPGLTMTQLKNIASDKLYEVVFDDVSVSADAILGELDDGMTVLESTLLKARAIQCAMMVGGAQQELEITAEYTRTRVQFGQPIGAFQAVQHRAADMLIDTSGARLITYQAVWRLNEGLPAEKEVALAKSFTDMASQRVALGAQQLHAGIGFDTDYDLHFYYRRQKAFDLRLGTTEHNLKRLEKEYGL
ncbi:MAG: acyl-CoA dehydrogenase family protein [Dehalococcoidia bacterium]